MASESHLRTHLLHLGDDGATGRLAVRGVAGGWVYLRAGGVYCAERVGRPTMLVAMGEAGLFTAEEWTMALRLPFGPRWPALVGGDPDRLDAVRVFARAFVLENLGILLDEAHDVGRAPTVFAPGVAHPFGPLDRWPVEELLGALPPPPPRSSLPAFDRAEFLELLEEVSPHVRRIGDGLRVPALEGTR